MHNIIDLVGFISSNSGNGGGNGGGTSQVTTEDITFAQLLQKKNNNQLELNKIYRLTDYRSFNYADEDTIIYGENTEVLLIKPLSTNKLSSDVISESYPNDIIKYDIDKNYENTIKNVEYEDGDNNGTVNVTATTTDTVTINSSIIMNDDFYLYASYGNNEDEIEYDSDGNGTDFQIIDNGDGTSTIKDLTGNADFDNQDYTYIEMSFSVRIIFNGKITYREDTVKNIKANYDFRNFRFYRYKIDTNQIQDYDSNATYNIGNIVSSNGKIYASITYDNQNKALSDSRYWIIVLSDINNKYMFANKYNGINLYNAYINPLEDAKQLFYTFSDNDGIYNDENIENVFIKKDNNVFISTVLSDILINSTNCTYFQDIQNSEISGNNSVLTHINNSTLKNINSCILLNVNNAFINRTNNSFISANNINVEYNLNNSLIKGTSFSIGSSNSRIVINGNNIKIGDSNYDIYLKKAMYITMGNSNRRIYSKAVNIKYNTFGNDNKYIKVNGNGFINNEFRNSCGRNGTYTTITGNVGFSYFGDNTFWAAQSNLNHINKTVFDGNTVRISSPYIASCHFGYDCAGITSGSMFYNDFGSNCKNIDFNNTRLYSCNFDNSTQNLSMDTDDPNKRVIKNDFKSSNINFGSNATHIFNSYQCTIKSGTNGNHLVYIDDNGVQQIVDPTT